MLRRTGFKRPKLERKPVVYTPIPPELRRSSTMASAGPVAAPKTVAQRNPHLLAMARSKPCLLAAPGVCNRDTSTTVAAHSNSSADGKGGARKADDHNAVWSCFACHSWLDQGRADAHEKAAAWAAGVVRQIAAYQAIVSDPLSRQRDRDAAAWALARLQPESPGG